jgi:hypothetical protein
LLSQYLQRPFDNTVKKFPPAGGIGDRGFPCKWRFDIKTLCLPSPPRAAWAFLAIGMDTFLSGREILLALKAQNPQSNIQ